MATPQHHQMPAKAEPLAMDHLWSRAQGLARALPPFLAAAQRRQVPTGRGMHGRRRAGMGDAFWQFRPFQQGDGRADIDWRRSARSSDEIYVRQTEWEAQQTIWFWCDLSASMAYQGGGSELKRDRAILLTLAAAHALAEAGERVALARPGARPASGRFGTAQLRQSLILQEAAAAPCLDHIKPGQHLVLISDFLMEEETLGAMMIAAAASRARLHLLQILSPAEMDFPLKGRLRLEDPEGSPFEMVERGEDMAAAYRQERAAWQDRLAQLCRHADGHLLLHRTDRAPSPTLLNLAQGLAASGAAP